LPVTHPYNQRIAKEQQHGLPQPPPSVPSVNGPSTSFSNNGSLNKNKLVALCEHHEHMVTNPTVADFLSDFKKMLN
jgi:hypothetical protein